MALAQIELQKAQLDLGSTRISAEMDGYIVNRSVEDGAWVNQGDLLYQVVNIDVLNVRLLASEYDIGKLRVGQEVEVWAEANPDLKVRSQIKRIGVEIDPVTFAYLSRWKLIIPIICSSRVCRSMHRQHRWATLHILIINLKGQDHEGFYCLFCP